MVSRLFHDVDNFLRCCDFCEDISTMWRLFYGIETFLQRRDFSAMFRLFYGGETFLRCREFSAVLSVF